MNSVSPTYSEGNSIPGTEKVARSDPARLETSFPPCSSELAPHVASRAPAPQLSCFPHGSFYSPGLLDTRGREAQPLSFLYLLSHSHDLIQAHGFKHRL